MYDAFCCNPVFLGDCLEFVAELPVLQRWLLKLCYNSGRSHNSDVTILKEYRQFILGKAPCPGDVRLYVHVISPTDLRTQPPSAARSAASDGVWSAKWFRFTQMRRRSSPLMTDIVQRQVYIDGLCFSLFVPAPGDVQHTDQMRILLAQFEESLPTAQLVQNSRPMCLATSADLHVAAVMYPHLDHYPTRYGLRSESEKAGFGNILERMAKGDVKRLLLYVTSEEIQTQDTSFCRASLADIISSRESAMSAIGNVALFTDDYDDDPRELWEIPEARQFFKKLFDECPFIFMLALPDADSPLRIIMLCYCRHSTEGNTIAIDSSDLSDWVQPRFAFGETLDYRVFCGLAVWGSTLQDISWGVHCQVAR
ncbi:hypothetical protein [Schlesneria sp. T3-172]|uniref:hypothetical protein n=1 Tax=Schlesneria sphaerica TaxID=3373610 RepID=UPI0037CB2ECD